MFQEVSAKAEKTEEEKQNEAADAVARNQTTDSKQVL